MTTRKKFAANLLFLIAANLLIKPYWIFGIDRLVQNKVGAEAYGTYFAVFNYTSILSILLDFGINNFNNRAVARNNKRLGEYLLNLMTVKFFLAVIYFAITCVGALYMGYNPLQMQLLLFLAVNQILLSAILYFRSNIAALQFFKTDSVISVLDRLLSIVFCVVLIYMHPFKESFNVMWFIYAQTVALLITTLVSFAIVAGKAVIKMNFWKSKFTGLILLKSVPFATLALLMGIYYRIDAVMINEMLPNGASETGIYAASFRLLDAVNQFGYLFATLLLPMFAAMIKRKESLTDLVKFSSELLFAISVTVGVTCYFFSNEMMLLQYPNSTTYWSLIFGLLMTNFIPMASIYVFGTLLTAKGSLKVLNYIAVGGMFLNIALNLYLIPHYGALGATIATLITQVVAAAAHIIAANRQFGFRYETKDLLKLSAFTVLCIAAVYGGKMLPFNWMINFVLSSGACVVIAFAIRLIPLHEFLGLIRSKATS